MADSVECVYLIGNSANTLVKIGRSIDVQARLAKLQTMSPVKLTLLWQTLGGAELEKALHRRFDSRRAHGEWFSFPEGDVVDQVVRILPEVAAAIQQRVKATQRAIAQADAEVEACLPEDLREQWAARNAKLDEIRLCVEQTPTVEHDPRVDDIARTSVPTGAREVILRLAADGAANRVVVKMLGVSPATAHRYLSALGEDGVVEMRGRGRAAVWQAVADGANLDANDDAE
jgi:hypothetical protein